MKGSVLLLFDVDGTLLLTGGAGMRAMRRVGDELFGRELSWDGIRVSGHLDPLIFRELADRNGLPASPTALEDFRDAYLRALRAELEVSRDCRTLPGVSAALAHLREQAHVLLGLLTGNFTDAIPIKFAAAGLDASWFPVTALGDEAPSRSRLAALALDRARRVPSHRVAPERTLVVGDTPRDVACAHDNGCLAFGIATGRYGTDELRQAGADWVVESLADPLPLYDVVERLATS